MPRSHPATLRTDVYSRITIEMAAIIQVCVSACKIDPDLGDIGVQNAPPVLEALMARSPTFPRPIANKSAYASKSGATSQDLGVRTRPNTQADLTCPLTFIQRLL